MHTIHKKGSGTAWANLWKKIYRSWQQFGTVMVLSKIWEKYVVDRYRFRRSCMRTVPQFPAAAVFDEVSVFSGKTKALTVCYLLHYFYPDKQGGTERFILNLAKCQQQLGNQVLIITLGKRTLESYHHREDEILWEEFEFEGLSITQIRYVRSPKGLYYDCIDPNEPRMTHFAEKVLSRYAPDIVHFAYPQPFASFAKVCAKQGIPYIVTLTDFNMFCHYATMVRKNGMFCSGSRQGCRCQENCRTYGITNFLQRYQYAAELLQKAQYITVPSQFVASVFGQEFPNINIHMIPHGIDSGFTIKRRREETRTFLYAGTLSELKGVRLLIQAFQRIPGNAALLICGGGDSAYVRSLMRTARNDLRIRFCGEIPADEMSEIYQKVDCVVVPSIWYETYNFVLREALACGCIGVAANLGAMPEVIEEGQNGFIFEAGDVGSLYAALCKAAAFDWTGYQEKDFPDVKTEALQYQSLYQKA